MTLAHLDGLDLRRAADGWHGIWHVDGIAHQFWLPEAMPDAAAFYAVTLPMDPFWNFVLTLSAGSGVPLTAVRPVPISGRSQPSSGNGIYCRYARSMPGCMARAIAPSPKSCSAFAAPKRISRVTRAKTRLAG